MGLDIKSTCPTTYVKESSSTLLPPFLKKKYNIEWNVIQYSIANLDNHPRLSFFLRKEYALSNLYSNLLVLIFTFGDL